MCDLLLVGFGFVFVFKAGKNKNRGSPCQLNSVLDLLILCL